MKIGWKAVAVLALSRYSTAADMAVSLTAGGPITTSGATRMASELFQRAGVLVEWRRPGQSASKLPPGCLRVELRERTPNELLPGALAKAYPYAGCSKSITVFFDRIQARAHGGPQESALLAYVLVHEITHVIQGVDRHSEMGVMKANWSATDMMAIYERRLGFAEEDVELIHQGLAGWINGAALNCRSGSGIAVRPD
jgi:hypothetical protein